MTAALDEDRARPAVGRPHSRRPVLVGCVAVAAVLVAAFGYEARVSVAVPTQEVMATAAIPVAGELDRQRASRTEKLATTGGVGERHATGRATFDYSDRVTVLGCFERGDCPPPEFVVPVGTRVATCADRLPSSSCRTLDVVFVTQAPLRLRTETSAEVSIRAVEPGTRGNVKFGTRIRYLVDPLAMPKHTEVRLVWGSETTGGTDVATGIVAQADVDRVVEAHETKLRKAAEKRLRDHADDRGLAAAVTTIDLEVVAEPTVGSSAPTVQVTAAAVARGVGYDEDRLGEAVERALIAALPPGQFLVPDSVAWSGVTVRGGEVVVEARARSSAVDPAAVRRQVARRWTASARSDLERRYGATVVRLGGRPLLLPLGPLFRSQVDVTFDTMRHR